jgi:hypothetical protein
MYAELEARAGAQQMEGVVLRYGFFSGPNTWYHPAADGELGTNLRSAVSTAEFGVIRMGPEAPMWGAERGCMEGQCQGRNEIQ